MRWQGILGIGTVVVLGLAGGCARDQTLLAADNKNLLEAIAQAGLGAPSPLSRAQKPEGSQTSAWDAGRERPTEIAGTSPTSSIRAIVNGSAILDEEIRATCYFELQRSNDLSERDRIQRQTEVFNDAREKMIDRELIIQEMEHLLGGTKPGQKALDKIREAATQEHKKWVRTVKESPQIQKENPAETQQAFLELLQHMGTTPEMMKRNQERQFLASEFTKHKAISNMQPYIGHINLVEYYESHPEEFQVGDLVEWQDIFIAATMHPTRAAARRFAEVLADRGRSGEDFARLAEQYDNGITGKRPNASGDGMKRGEIRPTEAEPILFQMRDGDVSLVEIATGYHVVKVVKRTLAGKLPFDDKVQRRIKDKLMNDLFQREVKRLINDLRRRAIIERID